MESGTNGPDYPALVKGMARDYISRPASIIVAVVTCKEDLDTQCVLSMAREVDPEGKRTIGVVTKPDCIEPGCHTAWVDVVTGRRWPLRLGYYILKNPAQSQLGMDFAAARAAEAHYFAATHPWSGLAAGYSSRFGAAALRSSLSKLMAHLIGHSLPGLTASAQQQLSEVQAQLARLPPALLPPSTRAPSHNDKGRHMDGLRLMAVLLDQISAQLMGQLSATGGMLGAAAFQSTGSDAAALGDAGDPLLPPPPTRNLWIDLLQLFGQFKGRVYGTKPHFQVAGVQFSCITDEELGTSGLGGVGGLESCVSAISIDDLPLGGRMQSHPLGHSSSINVASTASLFGGGGQQQAMSRDQAQLRDQDGAEGLPHGRTTTGGTGTLGDAAPPVMTFKDVKDLADSHKGLELPGFSPYSAELLISENTCAFTMNRNEFELMSSAALRQLKEACAQGEAAAANSSHHNNNGRSKNPSNGPLSKPNVLMGGGLGDGIGTGMFSDLGRDHVLTMIAVSLAYFKMSSRRVVDGVPLLIMHHLLGRFGPILRERLMSRMLTGNSDSDLQALLAEDEATRTYRAGLLSKNAMLETAVAELRKASLPLASGRALV
ncbi:hypothetical protein DUNSADRAFT_16042 [Dunaliella salina]|uniref:GED domain-containing protein n=1 Tax=Dunaliella salina TaxID=3046 RepID=A0ABQ7G4G8_DUNSA|nr:hypothetical protein DUNSADRAFT_16042 [Dunaliella salina]|eukprot:KAF5829479.1 hypothetical protein DUNSADRAFT_16042 [Dunaliella salina]